MSESDNNVSRREFMMVVGSGVASASVVAAETAATEAAETAEAAAEEASVSHPASQPSEPMNTPLPPPAAHPLAQAHEDGAAVEDTVQLDPAVAAFFGPIGPGTQLASCRIQSLHGVEQGGVAVVLEDEDGALFQLDVLRKSSSERELGIGNSEHLSVFLDNSGDGATETLESHGLAAMSLGEALKDREASGVALPEGLRTLHQRLAEFPNGRFRVA